jgi:putative transposase
MPEYRRSLVEGGTFFFTVVTYHRRPIFASDEARSILHSAWNNVMQRIPFMTDAVCLLPDHLHCIWTLPEGDKNYSLRWGEIKRLFSQNYHKHGKSKEIPDQSRAKRGEALIWQRRFWEHTIRDEFDLKAHLDYIHFNPVKHGLVDNVSSWPWSSFHRYVKSGFYAANWGSDIDIKMVDVKYGE